MKTMLEARSEEKLAAIAEAVAPVPAPAPRWAEGGAMAGAVAWAAMALLARLGLVKIGTIELLFLFAALVIVPLGMELGRLLAGTGRFGEIARRVQPLGAVLAVAAMCLPPGRTAAWLSLGWLAVCALMAVEGFLGLIHAIGNGLTSPDEGRVRWIARAAIAIGRLDLAVGGAWLLASRLGLRPMGIQEPIGLLTAVHFHFAGFVTATIGAATLDFSARCSRPRWLPGLILIVVLLPYAVAAGFVISPALKMTAAALFSASVAVLAVFVRACGTRATQPATRFLLQLSAGAVFAAMVLAAAYAIADFRHSDALTIPQMARTHGLLSAVGFCLPGLLGWLVEYSAPPSRHA